MKNQHCETTSLSCLLLEEGSEALLAGLDDGLLVVLANTAGGDEGGQPGTTLSVVLVEGSGLADAVLVVLDRLVVVGVVLRLGHCELRFGNE